MKNSTRAISRILWVIVMVFIVGCNSNSKRLPVILSGGVKPLKQDQILDYLNHQKLNYEKLVGVTLFARITMRDSSQIVEDAVKIYREKAKKAGDKNKYLLGYSMLMESAELRSDLVTHGVNSENLSKANRVTDLNHQILKIGESINDTTMNIIAISQLSANYFALGKNDSAEILTKNGFDLAYNSRDYVHIHFFGVNLGYVFNKKSMYGAAQQYFETALDAAKKIGAPYKMAVNNLIGLLVSEKNFYDADQLWNQEFSNKNLNPDLYEDQVIIINKAQILQHLGKYSESRFWINKINNIANYTDLQIDYHRIILKHLESEKKNTSAYLDSIKPVWLSYPPDGIKKMESFISHELLINPNILTDSDIDHIDSFVNSSQDDYYDWVDVYETIKGIRAQSKGDLPEAIVHFKKAIEIKELANVKDGISRKSDITEKLHIREQQIKLEESNILLNHEKNSYLWYKIITGAIITLGLFVIFIIFRERGRLKLHNNLVEKELILEKKSAEALQNENEINGRILALSKLVIAKADRINKLLMALNETNFKDQIRELKTESLAIQNAFSEAKPQLADKLLEDYSEIQQDFPGIVDLNISEKRIFVLSINGYHSKEIGSILGLTGQYVNNARTRVRKKLGITENWNEIKINKKNPNLI